MSRVSNEGARFFGGRARVLSALFILSACAAPLARAGWAAGQTALPAARKVGRYRFQSNPWVNLHQRLMHESRFKSAPPAALSGQDLAKWSGLVQSYGGYLRGRHPLFNRELIELNAALSKAGAGRPPESIPVAAARVLAEAMPLYRSAQWEEDDRANRFWMALAEPLLVAVGEELAEAHAKVYGVPFPTDILVDVSPLAWQFGAYTVGEGAYAHAVISGTEPGNQGVAALETLMHEPSHAIVGAESHAVGADLKRLSAELGVPANPNLWHAVLFYTSGELTRRSLARRGVRDYKPFILGMYERAYRGLRRPLETHWQAYLDGRTTREAALRQLLVETAPAKE